MAAASAIARRLATQNRRRRPISAHLLVEEATTRAATSRVALAQHTRAARSARRRPNGRRRERRSKVRKHCVCVALIGATLDDFQHVRRSSDVPQSPTPPTFTSPTLPPPPTALPMPPIGTVEAAARARRHSGASLDTSIVAIFRPNARAHKNYGSAAVSPSSGGLRAASRDSPRLWHVQQTRFSQCLTVRFVSNSTHKFRWI